MWFSDFGVDYINIENNFTTCATSNTIVVAPQKSQLDREMKLFTYSFTYPGKGKGDFTYM